MTEPNTTSIRPVRGIVAAILAGSAGALLCAGLLIGFVLCRWQIEGTVEVDRRYDVARLRMQLPGPVLGCLLVSGCAGFATWFPAGKFRFVRSLTIVFLVSIPSWWIGSLLIDFLGLNYKQTTRPMFTLSELFVVGLPPVITAALLSWVRIHGARPPQPPNSLTATTLK